MSDELEKLRQRVQPVLDEVANVYGGALQLAFVHGWRFRGAVSEKDWPVSLERAAMLVVAEAQRDDRGDVLRFACAYNSVETCSKRLGPNGIPCVWHERFAAAEALVAEAEALVAGEQCGGSN